MPTLSRSRILDLVRRIDRTRLAFLLLLAALAFVYRDLAASDPYGRRPGEISAVEGWFFSPTSSSPVLIYILTAWLAARRMPRLLATLGDQRGRVAGSLGIIAALFLVVWAYYVSGLDLLTASLALLAVSAGLFLSGLGGMKTMLLPAGFMLVLASPHPAVLVNHVVLPLQLATTRIAVAVLGLFGVAATHFGDQIITSGHIFHVIETCSGMRAMETLVMTAVVYAEIFHRSRRRLAILLLMAPFLGFGINQLRVLAMIVNPLSSFAAVHTAQGIVMLVLGVLLMHGADLLLCRLLPDAAVPDRSSSRRYHRASVPPRLPVARFAVLVVVLLLAGLGSQWLQPWKPGLSPARSIHELGRVLGDWHADPKTQESEKDYLGSTRFSQSTQRRYQRGSESVEVFIAADDHSRRNISGHSPKTLVPGAGWEVTARAPIRWNPSGTAIDELIVVSRQRERGLVRHWRENVASIPVEAMRAVLGLDRSPLRRQDRSLVFRLTTPIKGGAGDLDRARRLLDEFEAALLPAVRALQPPWVDSRS